MCWGIAKHTPLVWKKIFLNLREWSRKGGLPFAITDCSQTVPGYLLRSSYHTSFSFIIVYNRVFNEPDHKSSACMLSVY